jgi:opacity protein-like surface antigen
MKALLLVAALCLTTSSALADDANPTPRPGVSLGGRAAYIWNQGADAEDGDFFGGAQLRVYLAKFFAIEGSADFRQQQFGGGTTTVDIYPVQLTGLLYVIPNSPVSPFLLGGVGWYFTDVRGPGGFDESQNRTGAHVGAGIQFFMHRHWSLDATYRYLFTDRITTRAGNANISVNGDGHMVTGGLNFHF